MKINFKILMVIGAIMVGIVALIFYFTCLRSFQVDFEPNGGTWIATQQVRINKQVKEPTEPIKEGYIFEGWYLNDSLYDFQTPVTQNLTLVAHWREK